MFVNIKTHLPSTQLLLNMSCRVMSVTVSVTANCTGNRHSVEVFFMLFLFSKQRYKLTCMLIYIERIQDDRSKVNIQYKW